MVPGITVIEAGSRLWSIDGTDQYARRVEGNGTWTVYLVYSGIPARSAERTYRGLAKREATDIMQQLNARGLRHHT
jgi:hypothetical protein